MARDIVVMVKDGQETNVVRTAFEKVWKDKGWKLKGEKVEVPKAESKPEPTKKFSESATD